MTESVAKLCGNCRFFTPPKPHNQCGLCTVRGLFAGTLRPQPEFCCIHYAQAEARRYVPEARAAFEPSC